MTKMTSAFANKLIRKLTDEKAFWEKKETDGCTYVAALNEEPVIPDYDYATVAKTIADLDEKIVKIRHAINLSNCTNTITVGGEELTIDMVLVRMAQLTHRKHLADALRRNDPKVRIRTVTYTRNNIPEYEYINYDLALVKEDYLRIDALLSQMQLELDKYNQTVEFDVDVDL